MKRIAFVMIFLGLAAGAAQAHEKRASGGYDFVVGFVNEPAFSEQLNAVDLRVSQGDRPVEGLEQSVKVAVSKDGRERVLELRKKYKEPGRYAGYFIPSEPGDYAFRLTGRIEGREIDETFKSADGKFSAVADSKAARFP